MKCTLAKYIQEVNIKTTKNNEYPILTSSRNGVYLQSEYFNKQVASNNNIGYKIIEKGQFTYRAMSDTGKFYLNRLTCIDKGIVSPAYPVFKIVEETKLLGEYLQLYFRSDKFQNKISLLSRGSTRTSIKLNTIKNILLDIPNISVQEKIISNIKVIEDVIELRKNQLEKLDLLVKSRFTELFGDIVHNKKQWELMYISDLADIKIGPFGSLLHKEDYIKNGHALINPSNILDNKVCIDNELSISDNKYDELSAYKLEIGDIILARRGEMGRCAVIDSSGLLCGTGSMIIRPNDKIRPYFLQKVISSNAYKNIITKKAVGITMKNLNVSIVSNLKIPVPPIDLQDKYIALLKRTDLSKVEIQKSLDKLEMLKKSLMQQYFG